MKIFLINSKILIIVKIYTANRTYSYFKKTFEELGIKITRSNAGPNSIRHNQKINWSIYFLIKFSLWEYINHHLRYNSPVIYCKYQS
jgi:hypothetical protein